MKLPSAHDGALFAQWIIIVAGIAQLIAATVWSTWMIRAYRRDVKRNREGLCMTCGFDLRHSNDRCPECGSPIFKK